MKPAGSIPRVFHFVIVARIDDIPECRDADAH
jgi:hypothetical protein